MTTAAHRGDHRQADAVIVLGAAVHGDKVTWVLSNRLDAAIDYLNAHPEAIAVVSGVAVPQMPLNRSKDDVVKELLAYMEDRLDHNFDYILDRELGR